MFITVLEELIRQKGITSAKMLSDLDMNKSSVLNWKTRGTIPGGDVLIKLADYFAVPVDYLLGRGNKRTRRLSQFHYLKAKSTLTTVILYRAIVRLSINKSRFLAILLFARKRTCYYVQFAQYSDSHKRDCRREKCSH